MKRKNTGVKEIIQGHRAKMNSSDRSGLDQENQEDAEGWTKVISKSSKRMLRKKQRMEEPSDAKSPEKRHKRQSRRRS